jgi:hypothetical protein
MTPSTSGPIAPALQIDEAVDVEQIRLWNARNAMALLREFRCADRVLANWGSASMPGQVSFEVRFTDGHVVRGSHEFFRNGRRRCLLTTHVRRLLSQPASPLRYSIPR